MRTGELLERLDGRLTMRALNWWITTGQIVIEHDASGSGNYREFTEIEFRAIRRMCDERDFIHNATQRFANGELWTQLLKEVEHES